MTRDEIINLTEKWLNDVPDIKNKIKLIDESLNDISCSGDTADKIKIERHKLQSKLSIIIKAIGSLEEENQRIICYRYFDKLSYEFIAPRVGYSAMTIRRRMKGNLLDIGRVIFGWDDEFWNEIYFED
jgi:DNA-directed RNA polymerase specialized sigma subunit